MLKLLKNHPFAVEAFFERSLVLTFAAPTADLERLIPGQLSLDTFQDKWGFLAVAMVQARALRPKGFPGVFGNDFILIGYRIFVRYRSLAGKNLRGLYILKSETDRKKMEWMGNIFTHYNYTTTDIQISKDPSTEIIQSRQSDFTVKLDVVKEEVPLPKSSPFSSWKEAKRYAGPLPFTFSCDEKRNSVLVIEGVRSNWKPAPVLVKTHRFSFLESLNLTSHILANAFQVCDIPYYWKKGELERWQ